MKNKSVALILLALSGLASAQAVVNLIPSEALVWLTGLASNPVVLGLAVFGFVATIKRDAERRQPPIAWNPWLWRGISAGVGLVLALVLHAITGLAVLGYTGWLGAVVFGLVAATIAVIGRDGLKTVSGWIGEWGAGATVPIVVGDVLPGASSGFEPLALAALPAVSPQTLDMLVGVLLGAAGLEGTPLQMLRVGAKLAMVAPDLLDGDTHLSADNRARVLNVIMDLKQSGGLA